jgi:hypothetical protein
LHMLKHNVLVGCGAPRRNLQQIANIGQAGPEMPCALTACFGIGGGRRGTELGERYGHCVLPKYGFSSCEVSRFKFWNRLSFC